MSMPSSRAFRRVAALCVAFAVVLATSLVSGAAAGTASASADTPKARAARTLDASARVSLGGETRGRYSSTPLTLHVDGADVLAFPPSRRAAPRPLTVVYLHGARGRAVNGCPWFRGGASELGWLVCPQSTIEEQPDGSWSWGANVFEQAPIVERALRAARENGASSEPGIAVGFSQGSYVALDLVRARLARFRGLVLLGAELHPNAQTLKDAGVVRVALGAGELDHVAYASHVEEAKRLTREGIETRFFDLGRVGHTYAVEDTTILRDAIAFAGGE